jgi:hypothetical protein
MRAAANWGAFQPTDGCLWCAGFGRGTERFATPGEYRLCVRRGKDNSFHMFAEISFATRVPVAARLRGGGQTAEGLAAHFRSGGHIPKF